MKIRTLRAVHLHGGGIGLFDKRGNEYPVNLVEVNELLDVAILPAGRRHRGAGIVREGDVFSAVIDDHGTVLLIEPKGQDLREAIIAEKRERGL